jgi:hypothetical protein
MDKPVRHSTLDGRGRPSYIMLENMCAGAYRGSPLARRASILVKSHLAARLRISRDHCPLLCDAWNSACDGLN